MSRIDKELIQALAFAIVSVALMFSSFRVSKLNITIDKLEQECLEELNNE